MVMLTCLTLFAALWGAAPLRAGSAHPGGIRAAVLDEPSAPLARRLVGRWKVVVMESAGKPIPMPSSVHYLLILEADGTARVEMGQPAPKSRTLGRWRVKGSRLSIQTSRTSKIELVDIKLTTDRLTIHTPGTPKGVRLVLERVKDPRHR